MRRIWIISMSVAALCSATIVTLQRGFGWSSEALGPVMLAMITGICVVHLLLMSRYWLAEEKDVERERAGDQPTSTRKASSST